MMPSRGASALRGIAPRARYAQCRNYSSILSAQRTTVVATLRGTSARKSALSTSLTIGGVCSSRNFWSRFTTPTANTSDISATSAPSASSAPAAPTLDAINPVTTTPEIITPVAASSSIPDLDTVKLDELEFSTPLAGVEHIGFMKELGIDYGIGITSSIQWLVEHLHIWGDMPWWAAIAATAVTMRVLCLPLTLRASEVAARSTAMAPALQPFQDRLKKAQADGNAQLVQSELQNYMRARKEMGVSMIAMLTPAIAQGIIGYCGFRLLRSMTSLPVPGLRDGGFLWLTDLTVPDGYLILPAIMALSVHGLIRFGGESGGTQMTGGLKSFMLWGMPAIVFVITGWQSGALALWFTAAGFISMGTGILLRIASVRRLLGLTPFYRKPEANAVEFQPFNTATPAASTTATPISKASYMRPTYQAPTIRRAGPVGKVLDTTLSHAPSTGPTISGVVPKPGMLDSIKSSMKDTMAKGQAYQQRRSDKATQKRRDAAAEKAIEDRRNKLQR